MEEIELLTEYAQESPTYFAFITSVAADEAFGGYAGEDEQLGALYAFYKANK